MTEEQKKQPDNVQEKSSLSKKEEEILAFWQENKVFEKSLKKNEGKTEFVFYDGPPFATGLPHYGHILPGTMKDVIPRFQTMRGKYVPRRWGWDCHGLPIENIIEKELNLKVKKDIENFGVAKFNQAAREAVQRYVDDWKKIIPRTGRWADMENAYRTMDSDYTETVWWIFKNIFDKGYIYKGFKAMHVCPRCETTLSNFEVSQGYKDIADISVYVKFEIATEPGTFLLAWTTTPWTLPGNVALAIKSDIPYVKVSYKKDADSREEFLILAKSRLETVFKNKEYKVVEEFNGDRLLNTQYKTAFNYYIGAKVPNIENGWKVYSADFVTTEDGTGIVHIAPAFGGDDLNLANEKNLPIIHHVGIDGKFKSEVTDFAGLMVKPKDDHQSTDIVVLKNLAGKGLLFEKEKITHSYPHCWRCDTPLLNYATSSWFVKVSEFKNRLIEENKKVHWIPEEIRDGRFGKLLEGAPDWSISRSRYWGAPLPVWTCTKCDDKVVLGSIADIKEKVGTRNNYFVMRHGESESNALGVINSDDSTPRPLTSKGKDQVLDTAELLKKEKIDLIFRSPILRTKETAEIIAKALGVSSEKIITDDRLREINAGDLNGKSVNEYVNYFKGYEDRFVTRAPNGENLSDVKRRVGEFIYDINNKYEKKNILIVTHECPAWLLKSVSEGFDVKKTVSMTKDSSEFIPTGGMIKLEFTTLPHNENYELDFHKPYIDELTFKCDCEAGATLKRVPEVFDCWFESGSMPYGQNHYPFENKDKFDPEKNTRYPADFIAEGIDQTRGWFYSLIVLGTALFDHAPYKCVITHGTVLAEDGQKMSKHLKNYPPIDYVLDKYGADALRFYLLTSPAVKGEEIAFTEKGLDEVVKKVFTRLLNVVSFYELYKEAGSENLKSKSQSKNVLDVWILARLSELNIQVTKELENFELDRAARPFADFVDDLSTWYLRRSRERFKGDDKEDKKVALETIQYVLLELSKMMAPFTPFIAEDVYKRAGGSLLSVHLEDWQSMNDENQEAVIEEMQEVRKIVSLGLEARAKSKIKVRQPLVSLKVKDLKAEIQKNNELVNLIKDEINVKEVLSDASIKEEVELDIVITDELKKEGEMRDLVRFIQDLRKKEGLNPSDKVVLLIETDEKGKSLIESFKAEISKLTGLKEIQFIASSEGEETDIAGTKLKIKIIK
ncbi:MAG: class I tRNA ligase family protein [Candidatus Paceibacterota bacterium]